MFSVIFCKTLSWFFLRSPVPSPEQEEDSERNRLSGHPWGPGLRRHGCCRPAWTGGHQELHAVLSLGTWGQGAANLQSHKMLTLHLQTDFVFFTT